MSDVENGTQKLLLWFAGSAITIVLGVGALVYEGVQNQFDGQQVQINDNRNKIWAQQGSAITEETLSRRLTDTMQIVDSKIAAIQSIQQQQVMQFDKFIDSQLKFQDEIRKALKDKADKE